MAKKVKSKPETTSKKTLGIALLKTTTKLAEMVRKLELAEKNVTTLVAHVAQEKERAERAEETVAKLQHEVGQYKNSYNILNEHIRTLKSRGFFARLLNKE